MDNIVEIRIRNQANTGWDIFKPIGNIDIKKLGLDIPKSGDATTMTVQLASLNGTDKTVTIITETFRDSSNAVIKEVKTKIVSGEYPERFVEMVNIPGGASYEIFTVISTNSMGAMIFNDVVQPYGTWDASNPVTILG